MGIVMGDDRACSAISRIERALARIEAAAHSATPSAHSASPDAALTSAHEALKLKVGEAIGQIDRLLGSASSA